MGECVDCSMTCCIRLAAERGQAIPNTYIVSRVPTSKSLKDRNDPREGHSVARYLLPTPASSRVFSSLLATSVFLQSSAARPVPSNTAQGAETHTCRVLRPNWLVVPTQGADTHTQLSKQSVETLLQGAATHLFPTLGAEAHLAGF